MIKKITVIIKILKITCQFNEFDAFQKTNPINSWQSQANIQMKEIFNKKEEKNCQVCSKEKTFVYNCAGGTTILDSWKQEGYDYYFVNFCHPIRMLPLPIHQRNQRAYNKTSLTQRLNRKIEQLWGL